jgi:ssDNA-binding Zn-finger/Zn-ribbon topoisomerase 1
MKTSKAAKNGWKCPKCGDDTKIDRKGKGYTVHKNNPDCRYGEGERDGSESKKNA